MIHARALLPLVFEAGTTTSDTPIARAYASSVDNRTDRFASSRANVFLETARWRARSRREVACSPRS